MDAQRFDALTRSLASDHRSRRHVLRMLAAGTLATVLGRVTATQVSADCKHVGKKCDKDGDCCKGAVCKQKTCACKSSLAACGDACCVRGEECIAVKGSPVPPLCCPAAKVCGHSCCPPDRTCVCFEPPPLPGPPPDPTDLCKCICPDGYEENKDGQCVCPHPCGDDCCEAEDGETCCNVGRSKQCVQTDSNRHHCGGCGKECPRDRICRGGTCVCAPDYLDCGGTCIPKRFPNGAHGCCADADCDSGGFCCTAHPTHQCDPNHPGCGQLNHCVACFD